MLISIISPGETAATVASWTGAAAGTAEAVGSCTLVRIRCLIYVLRNSTDEGVGGVLK